jgi:archaellum component FlaF (FlaF/FlaG flagellin family)
MGFSLIAAAAIIGVAVLISLELIIGTTIPTFTNMHDSFEDMRDRAIDRVQTDVNITNVVYVAPNTVISVDNTGSVSVNTSNCNILHNGVTQTFTSTVSYFHPEGTAIFSFVGRANPGDIIKIVTPNGIEDYYEV